MPEDFETRPIHGAGIEIRIRGRLAAQGVVLPMHAGQQIMRLLGRPRDRLAHHDGYLVIQDALGVGRGKRQDGDQTEGDEQTGAWFHDNLHSQLGDPLGLPVETSTGKKANTTDEETV